MARPSITQLPPTGLDRFRGLLTRADDLTGGLLAAVPGIGTLAALNRSGNAAQSGDYTKAVESLTDVVPVGRLATRAIKGLTKGRSTGDVGGVLNIERPKYDFSIPNDGSQLRDYKSGAAKITLQAKPDGIEIASLRVPQSKRGSGEAKQALQDLVSQADKSNARLELLASPLDRKTSLSKLKSLYESVGFVDTGRKGNAAGDPYMERAPSGFGIQGGVGQGVDTRAMNQYPQQDALDLAQKRAALPVSEGGLGLPPDNTPMDRAAAMKGKPGFHFSRTGADVTELDSGKYAVSPFDAIGTHIGSKEAAQQRFENTARYSDTPKGVTYPVMMLGDKELLSKSGKPMTELELIDDLIARGAWGDKDYKTQNADLRQKYFSEYDRIPYVNDVEDAGNVSYIVPPQNLRSIYAAFDPFRRNEADLLAFGGNMGGTTLGNINPLLGLLDDENQ